MAVDLRHVQRTDPQHSATEAGLLYERYSGRILAYCIHALRHRGDAEDAVQTTFLHAHRALQRGVVPEHEFAWLHTIAKNVCRMHRRTAARRGAVTGLDLDALPAREGDAGDQELLYGLDDALASLPERQRRALVMRELRGLSSEEVASQLGMSATATYALLTRARRSLARALTVGGRSALGLDLGPLLLRLKALFAGGGATVAATTAVAAVVAAGGVTLERALVEYPKDSAVQLQGTPAGGGGGFASRTSCARPGTSDVSPAARPQQWRRRVHGCRRAHRGRRTGRSAGAARLRGRPGCADGAPVPSRAGAADRDRARSDRSGRRARARRRHGRPGGRPTGRHRLRPAASVAGRWRGNRDRARGSASASGRPEPDGPRAGAAAPGPPLSATDAGRCKSAATSTTRSRRGAPLR